MANFKGFKQVSLDAYNNTPLEEKKNYLWLVRDLSGETVLSSAIYFGSRKYAEVNDDAASNEKVNDIINTLGSAVDENGEWVGFLPLDEHEILGDSGLTSISDALEALEAAILANRAALNEKVSLVDFDDKVAELEEKIDRISEDAITAITEEIEAIEEELEGKADKKDVEDVDKKVDDLSDEVGEALNNVNEQLSAVTSEVEAVAAELDTKADADAVYSKDETYNKEEIHEQINAKVAGLFHFVDEAVSVSADETTITLANGDEVVAAEENKGDVYQIGDAEYASNGEKWVKLGFNMDLSQFATKEFVESGLSIEAAAREKVAEDLAVTQEALAKEIEDREELANEVQEIKETSTTTAATFSDAEEMDLQLGQIVYVTTSEEVSGITYMPGAYIYTQDGLKKLDSTTPSTSTTLDERVEALENNVGAINTALGDETFEGDSITGAIAALQNDETHVISGNDVEE